MPPPMISNRFGMSASSSASVESHQPLVLVREARDARRLRPGGDDAVIEGDGLDAVLGLHRQEVRRGELAASLDHGHLAGLGQAAEAARQLVHHPVLELAQAVEIDLGLSERQPEVCPLFRVGDHLRGVEQGLRRNAADVQADAADARVALDQHHLLAEVGRPKRRGVAAGPGAEHQDLGVKGRVGVPRGARPRRHRRGGGRARRRLLFGRDGRRRFFLLLGLRLGLRLELRGGRRRAPSAASSNRMIEPFETRSPIFTFSSLTVPGCGEGTSTVALSDSSVTSGASFATTSPAFT